jgi:hypothetical protein
MRTQPLLPQTFVTDSIGKITAVGGTAIGTVASACRAAMPQQRIVAAPIVVAKIVRIAAP